MNAIPCIIVVMGVSGSGKSTIAPLLAGYFGCAFIEGDDLHCAENIEKMRAGIALTDSDRWPWLATIGTIAGNAARLNGLVVVACSALKRSYRECIREHAGCKTLFVLLEANEVELNRRLTMRSDHYMPASLLTSQLALLEAPGQGELAASFELAGDKSVAIKAITAWIGDVISGVVQ